MRSLRICVQHSCRRKGRCIIQATPSGPSPRWCPGSCWAAPRPARTRRRPAPAPPGCRVRRACPPAARHQNRQHVSTAARVASHAEMSTLMPTSCAAPGHMQLSVGRALTNISSLQTQQLQQLLRSSFSACGSEKGSMCCSIKDSSGTWSQRPADRS